MNIYIDIPKDLAAALPPLDCVEVPFVGDALPLVTPDLADTPPLVLGVVPTRPTNNVKMINKLLTRVNSLSEVVGKDNSYHYL